MNADKETIEVVSSFHQTLSKLGVKKTTEALRKINSENGLSHTDEALHDAIIKITCKIFGVHKYRLQDTRVAYDEFDARTVCILQLKHHLNYSHKHIAETFKKTHAIVTQAINDFNDKDRDHPQDKKFLDKSDLVAQKIEQYKSGQTKGDE